MSISFHVLFERQTSCEVRDGETCTSDGRLLAEGELLLIGQTDLPPEYQLHARGMYAEIT